MEEEISYFENEGFPFFYAIDMEAYSSLSVRQSYYLATQNQMDNVGGLLWDYYEYQQR